MYINPDSHLNTNTRNIQYFFPNSLHGIRARVTIRVLGVRLHQTKEGLNNSFPVLKEVDHRPSTNSNCGQHGGARRRNGGSLFFSVFWSSCVGWARGGCFECVSHSAHSQKLKRSSAGLFWARNQKIRRRKPRQSKSRNNKRFSIFWRNLRRFCEPHSGFGDTFEFLVTSNQRDVFWWFLEVTRDFPTAVQEIRWW